MRHQSPRRLLALAALTVTGLGLLTGPAVAAPAAPADDERHCVTWLTKPGSLECFATFREALERASGGRLIDAGGPADPGFDARVDAANTAAVRAPRAAGARVASNDIVLSIDYNGQQFRNASLTWVGPYTCAAANYSSSSMPSGWNNRIESSRVYAGCLVEYFESPSFGGASLGPQGTDSDLGAVMRNEVSSERWT